MDEMTRSRGAMDHQARYNVGALEQRVYGLEQGVAGLSSQINALSQQISAGGKTNWSVLVSTAGFCLLFAGAVGGLAYAPIRENQSDLKAAMIETNKSIGSLSERVGREFVSVRELDARSVRTREELTRINQDINAVERVTVPRGEHEEKWRSSEKQFENQQRQIDDLKRFNTDLVSARDFLKNLDERMRSLERRPQS